MKEQVIDGFGSMSVKWSQLGLPDTTMLYVRDLWQHKDLGRFQGSFSASVNALDVVVIRLQTSSDFTTKIQVSCNPMKISEAGKKQHYSLQGKLLDYQILNGSQPSTGIIVEKRDKSIRSHYNVRTKTTCIPVPQS